MKLVYIAGAYDAPTNAEITDNITMAAIAAARVVKDTGAMPVCPHTMTEGIALQLRLWGTKVPEAFWYEGTAELLRRCDAVYVVDTDHVDTSKGTRAEVDLANGIGLPVFMDLGALCIWVEMQEMRSVTPLLAREPIEAGQLVALHSDGTVGPAR